MPAPPGGDRALEWEGIAATKGDREPMQARRGGGWGAGSAWAARARRCS